MALGISLERGKPDDIDASSWHRHDTRGGGMKYLWCMIALTTSTTLHAQADSLSVSAQYTQGLILEQVYGDFEGAQTAVWAR